MEKIELERFIERYLDDEMSKEERNWFEKELHGNQWLQRELSLRSKVITYTGDKEVIDFRMKLQAAESRHRKLIPAGQKIRKSATQYAALFTGLIIIGSLFFVLPADRDNRVKNITSTLSKVDPVITTRSNASNANNNSWDMAVILYNRGDYHAAVTWFEKTVTEASNENVKSAFMLGVSKMKLNQYNEAIKPFENVISHNDNLFIEDAMWYLGVCYLNIDEDQKAKTIFQSIADSESRYNKMARKSLRRIK